MYFVFEWDQYYPVGGLEGHVATLETFEQACKRGLESRRDYVQIVTVVDNDLVDILEWNNF